MSFPGISRHKSLPDSPPKLPSGLPKNTLLAIFNPYEAFPLLQNGILADDGKFFIIVGNRKKTLDLPDNGILSDGRWVTTREEYIKFKDASIALRSK